MKLSRADWVAINRRAWTEERRLRQREIMRRLYWQRAVAAGQGADLDNPRKAKHRERQARYRDRVWVRTLREREQQQAT
jgi:hypothetical protein